MNLNTVNRKIPEEIFGNVVPFKPVQLQKLKKDFGRIFIIPRQNKLVRIFADMHTTVMRIHFVGSRMLTFND